MMVQQSYQKLVSIILLLKFSLVCVRIKSSQFYFYFINQIDISKVQDDEVGDGTTSVVVLASELLRVKFSFEIIYIYVELFYQETENLLAKKIHPQTVIAGWRKATNEALRVLEGIAKNNRYDEKKKKKKMKYFLLKYLVRIWNYLKVI